MVLGFMVVKTTVLRLGGIVKQTLRFRQVKTGNLYSPLANKTEWNILMIHFNW